MEDYDVIIIGGGISGTCAGAILSKMGKKVLLLEKNYSLGGRCVEATVDGFTLMLGGHVVEDTGSGLGKVFEFVGRPLEGTGVANDAMQVYHDNKWLDIRDLYKNDKEDLKRIIRDIVASDYSEFDKFDNIPIRTWLKEKTNKEGIILLFETLSNLEWLTGNRWYDHSASESLYIRKLHYQERRVAGYSISPKGGWVNLCVTMADVVSESGGGVETGAAVSTIIIEKDHVIGVEVERGSRPLPNLYPETQAIYAPNVICTLPVWDVLGVLPEEHLPEWYASQIKYLARDENRASGLGCYAALDEPVYISSPLEYAVWMHGPVTGLAGFSYLCSSLDPSLAPEGKHLLVCGVRAHPLLIRDKSWRRNKFKEFDEEMDLLFPRLRKHLMWKKRYVAWDFNVYLKPGLVGGYRPDNKVPNIEGLWLAGDTYRSRMMGVDRCARSAITVAESILGEKIPEFERSWHY